MDAKGHNIGKNIECKIISHPNNKVKFGETCYIKVNNLPENTTYKVYLIFQYIQYPTPIMDWTSLNEFKFMPEALGYYTLKFILKQSDGESYWTELFFSVEESDGLITDHQPGFKQGKDFNWWAGNKWEAQFYDYHEKNIIEQMLNLIEKGWVIYDIGSNIGYHSMLFSKTTGPYGHVYCFEPNPLMVYFLNVNMSHNELKNTTIIPLAITDVNKDLEFRINVGNSFIGLGQNSDLFQTKTGLEIGVKGSGLDYLIDNFNLKRPDLIKLDIEGAEAQALVGMKKTISDKKPILILEAHGYKATEDCMMFLDNYHYKFYDYIANKHYNSGEEVMRDASERVTIYFCYPQ